MRAEELKNRLECFPIIAAIRDNRWRQALASPAEILFYLEGNILTVRDRIRQAHEADKIVFVHLDLAEGIGKDRTGIRYLAECGVENARVSVQDRGALDCVIRARVETAVYRGKGEE